MKIIVETLVDAPVAKVWSTYTKIVPNKLIEYSFGERAGVVEFMPGANAAGSQF
jgi:uncharacterized protein YndB with AHSA1/START domain